MNSAILNILAQAPNQLEMSTLVEDSRWQAVIARDGASDGKFVFAVSSTGVYCRPSCPSKRPRRENVSFFRHAREAESAGFRACLRCRPRSVAGNPRQVLVKSICRYIEQHLDEPITLSQLGAEFHQSPFHLQRTFKAVLGITPKEYANSCRMRDFRLKLKAGQSVTRAMHEAGYSSTSRLYSRTTSEMGMEPAKYRRGAIAAPIRYTLTDSPLGRMLIAATEKGICAISLGAADATLEAALFQEYPAAEIARDGTELGRDDHSAECRRLVHRLPAPRLEIFGIHRLRPNSFLCAGGEGDPPTVSHSSGRACMRVESGGNRNPLPSCRTLQWRPRRLPLGLAEKEDVT